MITKALAKWLTERRKASDWNIGLETYAALALVIAGRLDDGDVTGQLAKELRATLAELQSGKDGSDAFELLAAELSSTVRDTSD
jgi:hypothetical protein